MILIVNDFPAVSVAFGRALTAVGVTYEAVETLPAAIAVIGRDDWTGFVLDIFLPGGTGVDILEAIRRQPIHAHTPVALITADILLDDDLMRRIAAGHATVHMGVFDRPTIEAIGLDLRLARREQSSRWVAACAAGLQPN